MPNPTGPTPTIPSGSDPVQLGYGIGASPLMARQGAPVAKVAAATLTAAEVLNGLITYTNAGANNLQLPLATDLDAAVPSAGPDSCLEISVINLGAGVPTLTTNTGWTLVGLMAVPANNALRYRARKTAAGAWTLYQLA